MAALLDWDDIRFFLAVVRSKSISQAASQLSVNHTTVSRRISALEKRLGTRLFDRIDKLYTPSDEANSILQYALQMEDSALTLERELLGLDAKLAGKLTISSSDWITAQFFVPQWARFKKQYPEIELDVHTSYQSVNLNTREADIALRLTDSPPDDAIGKPIAGISYGVYGSVDYLDRFVDLNVPEVTTLHWRNSKAAPPWLQAFDQTQRGPVFDSVMAMQQALIHGMGIAYVPCMQADIEPTLRRVDAAVHDDPWQLWVLSHVDLRNSGRVKVFRQFIEEVFAEHRALIEGELSIFYSP